MRMRKAVWGVATVMAWAVLSGPEPAGGALRGDLDSVTVYPNPFQPRLGHAAVAFGELTNDVRIRIYSITGDLVRELSSEESAGTLAWDVRNGEGDAVATGTYLYVVTNSAGQKAQGKLAVLK